MAKNHAITDLIEGIINISIVSRLIMNKIYFVNRKISFFYDMILPRGGLSYERLEEFKYLC